MRILFVVPSSVGDYFSAQVPHSGIAYLAGMLKKEGVECRVIDMRLNYTDEDVCHMIDKFQPDFVGITLYSFGFDRSKMTINTIKAHCVKSLPACKVIIGGPHVAALRKEVLVDTNADLAVTAEGEYVMIDLARQKLYSEILGLIWRNGDEIIENPPRPFIDNLDEIPLPDYEVFELPKYLLYSERHLPITTSRGCPYQCIFCSIRLSMGLKFRPRSAENVVDELEYWHKKGWKSFSMDDDNFTLDIDRAMKVCNMIIERGLKIKWRCDNGIRADRVTPELLKRMKEAGCYYVSVGVEAGNNKILKVIKKGEKIETIIKGIKMAKCAGLEVGATFIIGHPEETYNDFMDSLMVAQNLPVDHISFYNLVPYPGTELYKWVEEHGRLLMDKETFLYSVAHWKNRPIFETDTFSAEERQKAYKVAHSLYRKKALQLKLGKTRGYLAWKLTDNDKMERVLKKIVLTPGPGRKLFNMIKRV